MGITDYDGTCLRTRYDHMPPSLRALGAYGLVRRWLDRRYPVDGTITSALHRRLPMTEAIRFVQEQMETASLKGGWDGIIPLYLLRLGDIKFIPERLFYRRMKQGAGVALSARPANRLPIAKRIKK